jgi:hypothetical protein
LLHTVLAYCIACGGADDLSGEVRDGVLGHAGAELPRGERGPVDLAVGAFADQGPLPEVARDVVQLAHGNGRRVDGENLRWAASPRRIGSSWLARA